MQRLGRKVTPRRELRKDIASFIAAKPSRQKVMAELQSKQQAALVVRLKDTSRYSVGADGRVPVKRALFINHDGRLVLASQQAKGSAEIIAVLKTPAQIEKATGLKPQQVMKLIDEALPRHKSVEAKYLRKADRERLARGKTPSSDAPTLSYSRSVKLFTPKPVKMERPLSANPVGDFINSW